MWASGGLWTISIRSASKNCVSGKGLGAIASLRGDFVEFQVLGGLVYLTVPTLSWKTTVIGSSEATCCVCGLAPLPSRSTEFARAPGMLSCFHGVVVSWAAFVCERNHMRGASKVMQKLTVKEVGLLSWRRMTEFMNDRAALVPALCSGEEV